MGETREVVGLFPKEARKAIGADLFAIQYGENPLNWKPIPSVGCGIREILISEGGEFRVFYLAGRPEGIHILHAFRKKPQKTPLREIAKRHRPG